MTPQRRLGIIIHIKNSHINLKQSSYANLYQSWQRIFYAIHLIPIITRGIYFKHICFFNLINTIIMMHRLKPHLTPFYHISQHGFRSLSIQSGVYTYSTLVPNFLVENLFIFCGQRTDQFKKRGNVYQISRTGALYRDSKKHLLLCSKSFEWLAYCFPPRMHIDVIQSGITHK